MDRSSGCGGGGSLRLLSVLLPIGRLQVFMQPFPLARVIPRAAADGSVHANVDRVEGCISQAETRRELPCGLFRCRAVLAVVEQ